MKKSLFIGSTVLDIVVKVDHLPASQEDINTQGIDMALGGCAYNASSILHHMDLPYIHCCACGEGFFGNCVAGLMEKVNKKPFIRLQEQDNGCCICLVDDKGERSFLCQHGVEYRFNETWLADIDMNEIDSIYICGLEIEDIDGEEIIEFLEKHQDKNIYFAPSARILSIQKERMKRMMQLRPILHLNESEALSYTQSTTLYEAARKLYEQCRNTVIITAGRKGAWVYSNETLEHIPGITSDVIDTIGAGDSHIGTVIACRKIGYDWKEAITFANKVAGKVVSVKGAALTKSQFQSIK